MSKYTTGEIAKLCGVTVRTVQYYDTRGILVPSELSEGGRRLYSGDDLKRLKLICFLRELDLPINTIAQLLEEEKPEEVVFLLLDQQEKLLREEIAEQKEKLEKLEQFQKEMRSLERFSVESIGDIAVMMESKKRMSKLHRSLLLMGLPMSVFQWCAVILWITSGLWWLSLLYCVIAVPYGVWISRYYFKRVVFICPECHEVFKPPLKEAFWANHNPTLRKLTCPHCGEKRFCIETYGGSD